MGKRSHNTFQKKDPDLNAKPQYPSLTKDNIDNIENKVHEDKKYGEDLKELSNFFTQFPTNTNRDIIIHKILLVDFTNSTNLKFTSSRVEAFSIYKLAEQLIEWNIDKGIENGDPAIVDKISHFCESNIFSFATKYCCYHNTLCYNKDDYSIFDRVVVKTLPQYIDISPTYIDAEKEKGYSHYHNIISDLIDIYELNNIDKIRRKIDHFLWFPNKDRGKDKKQQKNNKEESSSADLFANNND